ncbi:hypothetical protein ADK92_16165 [Streptomyces sp. XY533]|nr:hypothetical protein ADK92_16165 [Streptomyces sp. XY533]
MWSIGTNTCGGGGNVGIVALSICVDDCSYDPDSLFIASTARAWSPLSFDHACCPSCTASGSLWYSREVARSSLRLASADALYLGMSPVPFFGLTSRMTWAVCVRYLPPASL